MYAVHMSESREEALQRAVEAGRAVERAREEAARLVEAAGRARREAIRAALAAGWGPTALARELGVTRGRIYQIRDGG